MKPKMFISSSSEGLGLAYAAQVNLQSVAEITVWTQGAIKPSSTILESLQEYLDNSDFALFVFSPDDTLNVRGEESSAVRDNVIFELGSFTGRLGRERCFILVPEGVDLRIPTDLLGITLLKFETQRSDKNVQAATAPACYKIQEAISRLGLRIQAPGLPTAGTSTQEAEESVETQQATVTAEARAEGSDAESGKYQWLYAFVDRDYDRAIQLLQERIEEEVDEAERIDLKSWLGRSQYEKDPQEGEASLEKLIESHPELSAPFLHLAQVNRSHHFYPEALAILERGLSSAKDRGRKYLLIIKAELLAELGRAEEALAILRQGLAEFPEEEDFYGKIAEQLKDTGEYEAAREILEKGIMTLKNHEDLLDKSARLLSNHFEPGLALVRLNQLVKMKPGNPHYLTLRANMLLDLKFYDLAMRDYKQANELAEEKQAWILANIGNLYSNRGFFREALPYFNRALDLEREDEYAHERLAQSLKMRDEEEKKFSETCKQAQRKLAEYQASIRKQESEAIPKNLETSILD